MAWHTDDILFDPPQIEVVFTLDNNSNCKTMWKEQRSGTISNIVKLREVETEPNSALFLKAGGVEHCVSSLQRGTRTILKMVFVRRNALIIKDTASEVLGQFNMGRKHQTHRRSKKSRKK